MDGSRFSESVLEYLKAFILNLSPETKVSIVLFHVVNLSATSLSITGIEGAYGLPEGYNDPERIEKTRKDSTAYLEGIAKKIKGNNLEVTWQIVEGTNPAEEIIKAEQELKCDLVAMATHGRSGLSRWAFGSVTDKVLRAGTVPVLLVRTEEKSGSDT